MDKLNVDQLKKIAKENGVSKPYLMNDWCVERFEKKMGFDLKG